ncbi:MAG: hypothetical protein R3F43_19815 [bacterium]
MTGAAVSAALAAAAMLEEQKRLDEAEVLSAGCRIGPAMWPRCRFVVARFLAGREKLQGGHRRLPGRRSGSSPTSCPPIRSSARSSCRRASGTWRPSCWSTTSGAWRPASDASRPRPPATRAPGHRGSAGAGGTSAPRRRCGGWLGRVPSVRMAAAGAVADQDASPRPSARQRRWAGKGLHRPAGHPRR